MKQQPIQELLVVVFQVGFLMMTSMSTSAFFIHNYSSIIQMKSHTRISTKRQVVDSPSLFSEAQEEEQQRARKQKFENIKSKIKETAHSIRTYNHKNKKKTGVKPLLVDNIMDYKSIVVEETQQLVIVFFHAVWCKSCRVTKPLFQKVCQENSNQVKFVHVPLTKSTAYLQQGLGVPSVPYVHIYHPNTGLVEEMKLSKHYFQDFRNKLQTYVQGYCFVDDSDNVYDDDLKDCNDGQEEEEQADSHDDIVGVFQ
jgi:thiol-disulfide isomerase/thioredoxin